MWYPDSNYSVIRIGDGTWWDHSALNKSLGILKKAQHNPETSYEKAPHIVSCVSSIRYLIRTVLGVDFSELELSNIQRLPKILLTEKNTQLIPYNEAIPWDLVFYFWWLYLNTISFSQWIKHAGIVIDKDGSFYHSTLSGGGHTISDLCKKVTESKVANNTQLLNP